MIPNDPRVKTPPAPRETPDYNVVSTFSLTVEKHRNLAAVSPELKAAYK